MRWYWKRKTRASRTKRFGTLIYSFGMLSRVTICFLQYRENNPEYIKKMFRYTDENGRRYRI